MNKCVCDICCKNEVEHKFKFKRYEKFYNYCWDWSLSWNIVDICDSCYEKFLRLETDKKLADEIIDNIAFKYKEKYPDNTELATAYLDGVQSVYDLLIHRKISKN